MEPSDLLQIATYVMPAVPLVPCDIALVFGTRHGVETFCTDTHDLWRRGLFKKLLVSGGHTGDHPLSEAQTIGSRLRQLGIPEGDVLLENSAMNTGENVILGRARLAETMDISCIASVFVIGKICAMRRYLMTMKRHWPEVHLSGWGVNYFGVAAQNWHASDAFRQRVLDEYAKIPRYLEQGFLTELENV